jgi:hypothetical protein
MAKRQFLIMMSDRKEENPEKKAAAFRNYLVFGNLFIKFSRSNIYMKEDDDNKVSSGLLVAINN